MDIIYPCCAGLDVHLASVWACVRRLGADGRVTKEIRRFGTMTEELVALRTWLLECGATHAAMESTGVLWKPIYNVLDGHLEVWLCNAQHIRNVPGRKTDAKDCDWIAQLMQCGLLRPSFVPERKQRELRDLTRARTCLEDDRTRVVNRIHKVLQDANIKLSVVASDILGVSGQAILQKLIEGVSDPEALAQLARGRLKKKQRDLTRALTGHVTEHHRFMLRRELAQLRFLEGQVRELDARIAAGMAQADAAQASACPPVAAPEAAPAREAPLPFLVALKLLAEVWGLGQRSAENILAETGTDMRRFKTARHLASWAGMCPGNHQSAERNKHGRRKQGNPWLRRALTQAGWAASRAKQSCLSAMFKRLVKRRGAQRAIIAVGHSILVSAYHMLKEHAEYRDLGPNYYQTRDAAATRRSLVTRLERLGYKVSLEKVA